MFRPIVVAPAMNTYMFEHPVTQPQLQTIQGWGYTVLKPQVQKYPTHLDKIWKNSPAFDKSNYFMLRGEFYFKISKEVILVKLLFLD